MAFATLSTTRMTTTIATPCHVTARATPANPEPMALNLRHAKVVARTGPPTVVPLPDRILHPGIEDSTPRIGIARVEAHLEIERLVREGRVAIEHVLDPQVDRQVLRSDVARLQIPRVVRAHV